MVTTFSVVIVDGITLQKTTKNKNKYFDNFHSKIGDGPLKQVPKYSMNLSQSLFRQILEIFENQLKEN